MFTVIDVVEWQWLHLSVLAAVGAPTGAVSPSSASTEVVVTTFANCTVPSTCFGRRFIDVLFPFATWHAPQFVPKLGPYAALRWSVWFPLVGVCRWQIAQFGSAIVVPQLEETTATPLPSLWQVVVEQVPNGAP
jgi:hypothetical protein